MKVFALIFVFLLAATAVAWWIQPPAQSGGKTPLIWVSDDNPGRRAHIQLFNQLHPELELRLDPDNGGMEKVIVQSVGGVGPDLFDCYGPAQLASYVKADIAWDVTDELSRAGVNVRREVWSAVLPYVVYNGRIYGFPANVSADALWFNKDIFDREGIPYPNGKPWTWQQFLPLAQRLTVRDGQGHVKRFGFSFDSWMWKFFLLQWGGSVYSADGRRCTLDAPQAVGAVQFMRDLIYKYRVMPSPGEEDALAQEGGWGSTTMKLIGSGRLATAVGGRWWLATLRRYQHLRLGAVEAPHGPLRRFWGYGKGTIINKNSPHRREALKFLFYMTGLPYNRLINQQADGLAPVVKYCTPETLFNPQYPQEDYHMVFRDIMPLSTPERISPYVNAALAERIITKQLDLVRRDAKTPADAMRTAAQQINDEIQKTLRRDPSLRQQYEARP